MATVESLVAELNELCNRYLIQKETFKELDRIWEVFLAIKKQGFRITTTFWETDSPEQDLLSDTGKKDFEKMMEIRRLKMDAIEKHEIEKSADRRDEEQTLIRKLSADFSVNTEHQYFILALKIPDLVLFHDPDQLLNELFKQN